LRLVSAVLVEIDDKWAADTKAASSGTPGCLTPSRQNFQTSGCSIQATAALQASKYQWRQWKSFSRIFF